MTPADPEPPRLALRLTRLALDDLARALSGCEDPKVRHQFAGRFRAAFRRLQTWPQSGRVVPERASLGYRELIVTPYRVVYAVLEDEVQVLRIWHGRRDMRTAGFEVEINGADGVAAAQLQDDPDVDR